MRLLVIGGTAAGMSAAARARRLDPSLEIVVLEKGPVVSFGACGLPYYIEGRIRNAEQMVVHTPEYFRKQRNISVRTNAGVVSIAHSRRQVSVEGGEHERYDRLVIATGARPRLTGIAGEALPHVFNLHRMSDGQRLRQFIEEKRPKTALIVGAGYIGFEAADAFRHRGMRVAIASLGFDALNRRDPELTKLVSAHCERFGVEMRWNTTVQSVEDEPADVVLIAAGIHPNVEIAREAGIETGRTGAIRVDDRLQTNLAGVYAAGDCAETFHLVTGRHEWVPLGTTANAANASTELWAPPCCASWGSTSGSRDSRASRREPPVSTLWKRASRRSRNPDTSAAGRSLFSWSPIAARAGCWAAG
jgi:NADPH-dependent 2,4-dienoyl-CoA reductase/sulfur reductase-like enzyme